MMLLRVMGLELTPLKSKVGNQVAVLYLMYCTVLLCGKLTVSNRVDLYQFPFVESTGEAIGLQ